MVKKFIGKNGIPVGAVVKGRSGGEFVLLNPAGRASKFAFQLKNNTLVTNDGVVKKGPGGRPMQPTVKGRSYMQGYLAARSDNAKAYKSNQQKRGKGVTYFITDGK